MPNIELHGYGDKPIVIRNKIRRALKESPDVAEIVTTIHTTVVTTLDDKPSPFLRVISSPEGIDDLLELLKPLGEDIELVMLGQWIPKASTNHKETTNG